MTLMELLEKVSLMEFLLGLIFVVMLLFAILSQKKKILGVLNKWRKVKNEEDEFKELVFHLRDMVEELTQNRLDDREDSRKIRKEMYGDLNTQTKKLEESIQNQSKSIDTLMRFMQEEKEMRAETKKAEIKASIERLWWECHPAKKCTQTQFEVLKDLIKEYEKYGGDNSFVHSTVEPEMYEWQVIKNIKETEKGR